MPRKKITLQTRKPGQKPTEEEIAEFEDHAEALGSQVAGQEAPSQPPERPDAPEGPEPPEGGPTGHVERKGRLLGDGTRRGARELRRMTIYLPPDLAKRLTIHCAEIDQQYSQVIADALRAWLKP